MALTKTVTRIRRSKHSMGQPYSHSTWMKTTRRSCGVRWTHWDYPTSSFRCWERGASIYCWTWSCCRPTSVMPTWRRWVPRWAVKLCSARTGPFWNATRFTTMTEGVALRLPYPDHRVGLISPTHRVPTKSRLRQPMRRCSARPCLATPLKLCSATRLPGRQLAISQTMSRRHSKAFPGLQFRRRSWISELSPWWITSCPT